MNKRMNKILTIFLASLSLIGGSGAAVAAAFSLKDGTTEIPSIFATTGHVYVQSLWDGEEGTWWLLDTGAGISVVDQTLQKKFRWPASARDKRFIEMPSVRFGSAEWSRMECAVFPPSLLPARTMPYHGILGSNALRESVLELNFRARRVAVHARAPGADGLTIVPLERDRVPSPHNPMLVRVAVGLQGRSVPFMLDNGAEGGLVMTETKWADLRLTGVSLTLIQEAAQAAIGAVTLRAGVLPSVAIGGLTLTNVPVQVASALPQDCLMGAQVFQRLGHVWIDYAGLRLFLDPAAAETAPPVIAVSSPTFRPRSDRGDRPAAVRAGSYRAVTTSTSTAMSLGVVTEDRWFDGDQFHVDVVAVTNHPDAEPTVDRHSLWKLSEGWWLHEEGALELREPAESVIAMLAHPRDPLIDPYFDVIKKTPPVARPRETVDGVTCDVWSYEIASPDGRTTGQVTEWRDPSFPAWSAGDGVRQGLVKRYRIDMGSGVIVQTMTHDRFTLSSPPAATLFQPPSGLKRAASARVGTSAPSVTLTDTEGRSRRVGGPGSVRVVNFFATWCGPCKKELPDFVAVERAFRGRGVEFLGVDVWERRPGGSERPEVLREFLDTYQVTWPVVLGTGTEVETLYGLKGVPTTLVLDRAGRVAWKRVGGATLKDLTDALEAVLAPRP